MRAPHLTPPIRLALPDGLVADYVPDSEPPAYRADAIGCDLPVDVVIPDDLAAAGYFWFGSFLTAGEGLYIDTSSFPPPPFPGPRHDCYTAARNIEDERAKHAAARAAKPAKPARNAKPPSAPAVLVQARMELV